MEKISRWLKNQVATTLLVVSLLGGKTSPLGADYQRSVSLGNKTVPEASFGSEEAGFVSNYGLAAVRNHLHHSYFQVCAESIKGNSVKSYGFLGASENGLLILGETYPFPGNPIINFYYPTEATYPKFVQFFFPKGFAERILNELDYNDFAVVLTEIIAVHELYHACINGGQIYTEDDMVKIFGLSGYDEMTTFFTYGFGVYQIDNQGKVIKSINFVEEIMTIFLTLTHLEEADSMTKEIAFYLSSVTSMVFGELGQNFLSDLWSFYQNLSPQDKEAFVKSIIYFKMMGDLEGLGSFLKQRNPVFFSYLKEAFTSEIFNVKNFD